MTTTGSTGAAPPNSDERGTRARTVVLNAWRWIIDRGDVTCQICDHPIEPGEPFALDDTAGHDGPSHAWHGGQGEATSEANL